MIEQGPEQYSEESELDENVRENLIAAHWARVLKEQGIELTEQDVSDMMYLEPEQVEKYVEEILRTQGIEDPKKFLAEHEIPPKMPSDIEEAVDRHASYGAHRDKLLSDERAKKIQIITFRRMEVMDDVAQQTDMAPAMAADWQRRVEHERMDMVVAMEGDQAVGRAGIYWTGADERAVADKLGAVPMINALKVNESHREAGLGLRLMLYCELSLRDRVKEHPETAPALALLVKPDNEAALNLYEKLGYQYADDELYEASLRDPIKPGPTYGRLMIKHFNFDNTEGNA